MNVSGTAYRQAPDLVILDEATSGLDESSQGQLMTMLIQELRDATIISVGDRSSLAPFHTRHFALVPGEDGVASLENTGRYAAGDHRIPALRA